MWTFMALICKEVHMNNREPSWWHMLGIMKGG